MIPTRVFSCRRARVRAPTGRAAVTFCSWHPMAAMVRRGPVRGPSHPCKRCNQRHQCHDSVISVQAAHPERRAVLLIIRRSWVRAPPAPLHLSCEDALLSGPCARAAGTLSGPDGRRMTTAAYQERGRLAEALTALRVGAGLSGARLAGMLGWQQSKVSKIETRKQLPSEDDIAAWVGAADGSPETASELLAVLL